MIRPFKHVSNFCKTKLKPFKVNESVTVALYKESLKVEKEYNAATVQEKKLDQKIEKSSSDNKFLREKRDEVIANGKVLLDTKKALASTLETLVTQAGPEFGRKIERRKTISLNIADGSFITGSVSLAIGIVVSLFDRIGGTIEKTADAGGEIYGLLLLGFGFANIAMMFIIDRKTNFYKSLSEVYEKIAKPAEKKDN